MARVGADGIVLAFFAVATTVLTWPLAASPGLAISVRPDYWVNVWNLWWVHEALTDPALSVYATDFLHHPVGVSLARHPLSLSNSLIGAALFDILGPHEIFKLLLWIHFWLGAATFFWFARVLGASRGGAALAGLFWSFDPFHFYYLAQVNVATLEFLPLLGLFLVRSYRQGDWIDAIGVGASAGLLALSSSYYLVYGGFLGLLLLLGGRLWEPATEWRVGAQRLVRSALLAAVAVVAVGWRLLAADPLAARSPAALQQGVLRANDLLGYRWVGGPESVIVSWPTMMGYSGLLLAALGVRRDGRRLFWVGLCAIFLVLSLGSVLQVAGRNTGIPLPYRLFAELPILWMLRKPDRIFALVLLGAGVLVAFGWRDLARRIESRWVRRAVWGLCAALLCAERAAIPLETFSLSPSPYLRELARAPEIDAVAHLPHLGGRPADARSNLFQTLHGKKIPQGYVNDLALGPEQRALAREWRRAYRQLSAGSARPVVELARRDGIDVLLLHKTRPGPRRARGIDGRWIGVPFVFVRRELIGIRQRGHLVEQPVRTVLLDGQKAALGAALGPPVFEDDALVAYRVPPSGPGSR